MAYRPRRGVVPEDGQTYAIWVHSRAQRWKDVLDPKDLAPALPYDERGSKPAALKVIDHPINPKLSVDLTYLYTLLSSIGPKAEERQVTATGVSSGEDDGNSEEKPLGLLLDLKVVF